MFLTTKLPLRHATTASSFPAHPIAAAVVPWAYSVVVDVPQTGPGVGAVPAAAAAAAAGARKAATVVTELRTITAGRIRRYRVSPVRRKLIVALPSSRLSCRALRGKTGTRRVKVNTVMSRQQVFVL